MSIRKGSIYSHAEKIFLDNRYEYAENGLLNLLSKIIGRVPHITNIPKISIALSGGGYRAMICSLAMLSAFEDHGLLDLISYISSLSGSCWLLAI